ncbi:phosphatase PAP2 family protein [Hydrogenophaga sp. BPS33]|uniref:phosphatase PAP2 family protein n=1 Tax=Hydrogenophaga sp. BPS33 TaxID=2651974 RepID=UPI00132002AA|nr:phosphatase PAP2 family protein [Hydrogenophaga sp. BPS33]QHE88386.1 phosphatase PAP2 family protein [Hydrogenophaga sp. BPS33]
MSSLPARSWYGQLWSRFATLWYLKALGTTAFMVLFFKGYFWVLHHPLGEPVVMPTLAIDDWVPFTGLGFPAYVSLWFYVSLPSALMPDLRELIRYGLWTAAMCLFCLALFWVFPTQVPVPDVDWSLHPQLQFLKGIDASGNACPSLHVGSAVYSLMWLRVIFLQVRAPTALQLLSVVYCVVIVWSTMAIRQHVFLDVLAGALVGAVFGWLSLRREPVFRSALVENAVR